MARNAFEFSLTALTRFADVMAALRSEKFTPLTPAGETHSDFRRAAFDALCPAKIDQWKPQIEAICVIPDGEQSVDLVEELARPWSLAIAALVTGIEVSEAQRLSVFARAILDAPPEEPASHATVELARTFQDAFSMQAFVALSQTLPCFLANAWLALLQNPDQMDLLREEPGAMEELLRYAGPSAAILRYPGPVALMLADANRDPLQFPDPDRLDLRRNPKHVAFGAGAHSCVGASLIRMTAAVAMRAFVDCFHSAELLEFSHYKRFAIQSTEVLRIRVDRH
jgi:cytochrome P450